MAEDNEQNVELDVSNSQETEVEVNEDLTSKDDDRSGGSDDQFEKAETATQKHLSPPASTILRGSPLRHPLE